MVNNLNFNSNPYFENTKLTKTFTFLDDGTKITATPIKWKEGKGLPNGVNHEKKGNKRQLAEERFVYHTLTLCGVLCYRSWIGGWTGQAAGY
ncbi:hypothetical protein Goari_019676 [Gossypium aridum]|uniref:Uncharacterized protein n=1 Tax=Gossypium aridum TaxID=34290 RepID=A0A7J8WTU3_GOSAI|nr:hypothetical protein [Gossypium aridum]